MGPPPENPLEKIVAANIRRLRKERGWSQADLHRATFQQGIRPISVSGVALIETGKQRADRLLDLVALCAAFGVPLTELIAGDGEIDLDWDSGIPLTTVRQALDGRIQQSAALGRHTVTVDELTRTAHRVDLTAAELVLMTTYLSKGTVWDFVELRDDRFGEPLRDLDDDDETTRGNRGWATREIFAEIYDALGMHDGIENIAPRARTRLRRLVEPDNDPPPAHLRALIDEALKETT